MTTTLSAAAQTYKDLRAQADQTTATHGPSKEAASLSEQTREAYEKLTASDKMDLGMQESGSGKGAAIMELFSHEKAMAMIRSIDR